MTIQQIKAQVSQTTGINIIALNMVRQFETDNITPQPWLSHWDNDHRIRVTMHQDVMIKLKENPVYDGLAVKKTEVIPETKNSDGSTKEPYIRFVVITPNNIEAVF